MAVEGITVAGFYRFAALDDLGRKRLSLLETARNHGLTGTVLLACEGVNGTIAGTAHAVDAVLNKVRMWPGFEDLEARRSESDKMPFRRIKVRIKREIVTMAKPGVDPNKRTGTLVEPEDWDVFVKQPNVVLIDTRNTYETGIGTFEGALDPNLGSFGEFPDWWESHAKEFEGKTVAMFCTGGIRCEKASSWLADQGVGNVAQLNGGILAYLERIGCENSSWHGECFVFDERVSVVHQLKQGSHHLCKPCGNPIDRDARHCTKCGAVSTSP